MKQPALGIVATVLIMAVSLGVISLFDFATFSSWVIFVMASIIPMEIVIGVTWGANPGFVSSQPQPLKGILLVLVNIVIGVVVGGICHAVVGGSIAPPIPATIMPRPVPTSEKAASMIPPAIRVRIPRTMRAQPVLIEAGLEGSARTDAGAAQ